MRFWLSLVFGTILISFGLTWLQMHQGREVLSRPVPSKSQSRQELPEVVFELDKDQVREANVVTCRLKQAVVGQTYAIKVKLKNAGKGPLKLDYLRESCGCLEVQLDGKKFEVASGTVTRRPGDTAELTLKWRPEQRHLLGQDESNTYRFVAEIKSNDPAFTAPIRLEVVTHIVPPEGKK